MTDYPELVKALRICNRLDHVGNCNECFYGGPNAPTPKQYVNGCKRSMCEDAAAAIEELDAEETRLLLLTSDLQDKLMDLQADNDILHQHIEDMNEAFRSESEARQKAEAEVERLKSEVDAAYRH